MTDSVSVFKEFMGNFFYGKLFHERAEIFIVGLSSCKISVSRMNKGLKWYCVLSKWRFRSVDIEQQFSDCGNIHNDFILGLREK